MSDGMFRFYTEDLMIRASVALTTDVVQSMADIHDCYPLATVGMGRAITGALLLASQTREGQRIGLYFKGDGPLGGLFAEGSFEGEARAYCHNAQAQLPLKDGRLDVGGGVGKGTLTVTHTLPFQKQPHNGIVPIASGEISQDIAYYLFQSQQIPSVISLTVQLEPHADVAAAGGVLIELMPGANEKLVAELERKAQSRPPLGEKLLAGAPPIELVKMFVHDSPVIPMEHSAEIKYTCRCSRDRAERTLRLIGKAALAEMLLKGEAVPIKCEFCGVSYNFEMSEIREIHRTLDLP